MALSMSSDRVPFATGVSINAREPGRTRHGAQSGAREEENPMGIIWTIIIGFIAGVIAKFIMPGKNEPSGFILTTILGIVGAVVSTYLGQALGWYGPDEGAGFIGAIVGAVIVLAIWGMIAGRQRSV